MATLVVPVVGNNKQDGVYVMERKLFLKVLLFKVLVTVSFAASNQKITDQISSNLDDLKKMQEKTSGSASRTPGSETDALSAIREALRRELPSSVMADPGQYTESCSSRLGELSRPVPDSTETTHLLTGKIEALQEVYRNLIDKVGTENSKEIARSLQSIEQQLKENTQALQDIARSLTHNVQQLKENTQALQEISRAVRVKQRFSCTIL